jgi:putative lipoic acid-binding regulatory protein
MICETEKRGRRLDGVGRQPFSKLSEKVRLWSFMYCISSGVVHVIWFATLMMRFVSDNARAHHDESTTMDPLFTMELRRKLRRKMSAKLVSLLFMSAAPQARGFTQALLHPQLTYAVVDKARHLRRCMRVTQSARRASSNDSGFEASDGVNDEEISDMTMGATIRIDDGGSDLTDRFKYKVNALMGVFDPPSEQDNERVSGHILNAMVTFPVRYTFHVVGRGDSAAFVDAVRAVVDQVTGDDQLVMKVTPRGTKFTKLLIEANVQSSSMVSSIYEQLEALEQVVMKF